MKARVKETGAIIDVINLSKIEVDCGEDVYVEQENMVAYKEDELEFLDVPKSKDIDWKQRRFELIKAALQGLCANPEIYKMGVVESSIAVYAIEQANAVIEKLKAELI